MSGPDNAPARNARTDLPSDLTLFVGRERELNTLIPLVQSARLLSLLGPAGIGKSRLAVRLASVTRRRFPDGVWHVPLAPVTDGALLPAVVAGRLGIAEAGPGETLAVLGSALAPRRMLLLLDSCEHLIDPVACVVDELLQCCPRLTVLATSRARIGLLYETVWRVPTLALPDRDARHEPERLAGVESVALFLDRARMANPRFAVGAANAGQVVELVHRVDGIPLAVELAAAWMESLSPGELAAELDDRGRILASRRVVTDPHAGLWAAIESSYDRLDPEAQSLLRQLGVFAGGWNLGSMTTVCRIESGAAVTILTRLVDHSLIEVVPTTEGPTRYRLLNVLRRFAQDKLIEAGELDATTLRFVEHVAAMAERASPSLTGAEGSRWLGMLDVELENIRAVFATDASWALDAKRRLAISLLQYWHFRGLVDEGRAHLDAVARALRTASPGRADALNGLSWLSWVQGDLASASRQARAAFRVARQDGDRQAQASALLRLAQAQFDAARAATAGRTTRRAQEIATGLDDPRLPAECLLQLGQVSMVEGRLDEAEQLLAESVDRLTGTGPIYRLAVALVVLGRLHLQRGRTDAAEEMLRRSLTVARQFGMVRFTVPVLESLAAVAVDRRQYDRAVRLAGAAAGLLDRGGARAPRTAPMRAAILARLEPALSSPGADGALAEGRRMSHQQAIALALGVSAPPQGRRQRQSETATQILTPRQMVVARLVAEGLSNKAIAKRLGVTVRTAEGHVEQIFNRLGFNSRAKIAAWITRHDAET